MYLPGVVVTPEVKFMLSNTLICNFDTNHTKWIHIKSKTTLKTKLPCSLLVAKNWNLSQKICWKISRLYRNRCNIITACSKANKSGDKPPPILKKLKRTVTITAFINHFFDAVLLQGMSIIPSDLESEKEQSDDEFFWKEVKRGAECGGLPVWQHKHVRKNQNLSSLEKTSSINPARYHKRASCADSEVNRSSDDDKTFNEAEVQRKKTPVKLCLWKKVVKALKFNEKGDCDEDAEDSGEDWDPNDQKELARK